MDSVFSYERKREEDFYMLLGCDELSSCEQIASEYKVRALQCHPDKHPDDPAAPEQFACLQYAKQTLCDEESRKLYDTWRRSGMAMSYKEWCARKDTIHSSLHWAMKKKKEPMLEEGPSTLCNQNRGHGEASNPVPKLPKSCGWQGNSTSGKSLLGQFRNYQI